MQHNATTKRGNDRDFGLFGHFQRARWLIAVAEHGPLANRAIGRLIGTDCAVLPGYYRAYARAGAVLRDTRGRIRLDESFFAYAELAVLLRALAGERIIVVPPHGSGPVPRRTPTLLGTLARTRVLVALDALDTASVTDLAFTARVPRNTVRAVVEFFLKRGVLQTKRDARELHVAFDDTEPIVTPLRALLGRLAIADPRLPTLAQLVRTRVADRHPVRDPKPVAVPLPFGTPAQAAALVALAHYGPLTTAHLARISGRTRSVVRSAVNSLCDHALVVARTYGRGAGGQRWAALNGAHPLTLPLRRYVAASVCEPAPIVPLAPRDFRPTARLRTRRLPGAPLRTAVFCATYASGDITISDVATALGRRERISLRRWAEDLRVSNLVQYGPYMGEMTLRSRDDNVALVALGNAVCAFVSTRA